MARTSGKLRLGAAGLMAGMTILLLAVAWAIRDASASTPTPLLPDLVADAPDGQQLVSTSQGGAPRLLLRFNGYIHNAGPGALDVRASREAPHVQGMSQHQLEIEIQLYKQREESLPPSLEAELAEPPMSVVQRLFTTNEGNQQQTSSYLERPHVDEPSSAQVLYSSADGHHHWHLQRIVSYSLWDAERSAPVAPSQKVGFCLGDVQHAEPGVGPQYAVYQPAVEGYFCRRYEPNATSVSEGISPGWRDVYDSSLAFQWIDVSDVSPGEYWLREDIDPTGVVKQEGGGPKSQFAQQASVVPGFVAQPQTTGTGEDEALSLTLGARSYADAAQPQFTIVSGPQHGTLQERAGNRVQYVPQAGYSGSDSFTFSARDPASTFPEHPPIAAVQIAVASHRPALAISGAQSQIEAGSTMSLLATVANDSGGVEWSATSGTVTPAPGDSMHALYTAPATPPPGASATVTARLADDPAVSESVTVQIDPPAPHEPAPEPPAPEPPAPQADGPPPGQITNAAGSGGASSGSRGGAAGFLARQPSVSRPHAMLFGRTLVMSTVPSAAGRVRLTASTAGHRIGTCAAQSPAGRAFSCRISLPHGVSRRARIGIVAALRSGQLLVRAALPAARVPEMKMGAAASAGTGGDFWCEARAAWAQARRAGN